MTGPGVGRRPAVITILAIFQLVTAGLYGLFARVIAIDPAAAYEQMHPSLSRLGDLPMDSGTLMAAFAALAAVVAGLDAISALSLLRMKRYGWTIAMLMAGVGLAVQIANFWASGAVQPVATLFAIVTVLYLNQTPVRAAFSLAPPIACNRGRNDPALRPAARHSSSDVGNRNSRYSFSTAKAR